jgi:spermidine/putrescine transport system permease protein
VIATAFAMGIVRMRLSEMDPALEEASWNLGASQWRTIREVVLPQALPAIVAALLITMAVSWDEFVIAWYVSGFDTTLPVQIFNLFQGQVSPRINAIGSIVFAMTMILVIAAQVFAFVIGRRVLRGKREEDERAGLEPALALGAAR